MFLGGPGGTGKSRVISALKDLFDCQGQGRRLRLASYTGVAASNISGMTLHSALCMLVSGDPPKPGSKLHADLVAMWEGVDFLFVDEVSMIGCEMLAKLSCALSAAKGSDEYFGGINIIFSGDFAQLPPVGEPRLFGTTDCFRQRGNAKRLQNAILGRLLWLSVDTVVMLRTQMRQFGPENEKFVALLERLRTGACDEKDYDLLNSRLLSRASDDLLDTSWESAPVIVYDNLTKDALNVRAVSAYAHSTAQTVEWYVATDTHKRRVLRDPDLRRLLLKKHSGETDGLLGKLPLVEGMRVIIGKNFDVPAGIVNGSIGILRQVNYTVNDFGERVASLCVVKLDHATGDVFPGLGEQVVPVLQDSKTYKIVGKYDKKSLSIRRTQIALQPAYAFTSHRAQGQSYDRVVVDLQGCVGSEAPYVMLSRARSLDGLLILRPFDFAKISTPPASGLLTEWRRLRYLELCTLLRETDSADNDALSSELALFQSPSYARSRMDISLDASERADALHEIQQLLADKFSDPADEQATQSTIRKRKRDVVDRRVAKKRRRA